MSKLDIAVGSPDKRGESKVMAVRDGRCHLDRFDAAIAWKRDKFAEAACVALGLDPDAAAGISSTVATEAIRAAVVAAQGQGKAPNEFRPSLVCLADVESRPISWLWPGRIAAGRVCLIVGMPGVGKSFLTTDLAARVSTGTPWPDGSPCERGSVVLIGAEDDPGDTVRPRLDAHRADVSRVHMLRGVVRADGAEAAEMAFTLGDVEALRQTLEQVGDCKLVIVDPIGSFLGGRCDAHRDNEVRSVLAPVAKLAEESGAAVVLVAHRRKSAGQFADDSALGSRAFTGLARSVWHLSADLDTKGRRLLLPGKNNLGPESGGLAFSIAGDPAQLVWEPDPVAMTADEAMAREGHSNDGEGNALDEAMRWLKDALMMGPRAGKELKTDARRDGVAERTLERAKAKLGVENSPDGFGGPWLWRLPAASESANDSSEFAESAKENPLADTEKSGNYLADSGGYLDRCPGCGIDIDPDRIVYRTGRDGELLARCVPCGATWPDASPVGACLS